MPRNDSEFVIRIPRTKRYVGICSGSDSALCVGKRSKAKAAQKFSAQHVRQEIENGRTVEFAYIVALP